MLTTLQTLKSRLALTDSTTGAILTAAIQAVSARFDKETNRILARTENAIHEFDPADTELFPACYPIESITKWETKSSESAGWQEQPAPEHLIRNACIVSLLSPSSLQPAASRLTYTGGYVLPGTDPAPGQVPLPDDLEQAAVEQVAFWFQSRSALGIHTTWPSGGEYRMFATFDLLPSVQSVLAHHRRWSL